MAGLNIADIGIITTPDLLKHNKCVVYPSIIEIYGEDEDNLIDIAEAFEECGLLEVPDEDEIEITKVPGHKRRLASGYTPGEKSVDWLIELMKKVDSLSLKWKGLSLAIYKNNIIQNSELLIDIKVINRTLEFDAEAKDMLVSSYIWALDNMFGRSGCGARFHHKKLTKISDYYAKCVCGTKRFDLLGVTANYLVFNLNAFNRNSIS